MTSPAAPPDAAAAAAPPAGGVYCSTAGTAFLDKAALVDHYKSDFHRYNLKRKVAGLPPVTREWYDGRAALLASRGGPGGGGAVPPGARRTWFDPLTRKRFSSEATYSTYVASKKYRDAVKASGAPAPPPVVTVHTPRADDEAGTAPTPAAAAAPSAAAARPSPGYRVAVPNGVSFEGGKPEAMDGEGGEGDAVASDDGWETASDDDGALPEDWVEWDPKRCLFDNKLFDSVEANIEHMWKRYGFHLPDAAALADPEGLLRYLGSKLANGRVALGARGDDAGARVWPSLHAVQRHMVDTNQCKLAWDGNEAEYEDFYDYSALEGEEGEEGAGATAPSSSSRAMIVDGDAALPPPTALADYELALPSGAVLGSRHLARYYRQAVRPRGDGRRSEAVRRALVERYAALGVAARPDPATLAARAAAQKGRREAERVGMKTALRGNVNRNLPRNVPY